MAETSGSAILHRHFAPHNSARNFKHLSSRRKGLSIFNLSRSILKNPSIAAANSIWKVSQGARLSEEVLAAGHSTAAEPPSMFSSSPRIQLLVPRQRSPSSFRIRKSKSMISREPCEQFVDSPIERIRRLARSRSSTTFRNFSAHCKTNLFRLPHWLRVRFRMVYQRAHMGTNVA
jgi:hypothetical protein